jgi:hypothetical protein
MCRRFYKQTDINPVNAEYAVQLCFCASGWCVSVIAYFSFKTIFTASEFLEPAERVKL